MQLSSSSKINFNDSTTYLAAAKASSSDNVHLIFFSAEHLSQQELFTRKNNKMDKKWLCVCVC